MVDELIYWIALAENKNITRKTKIMLLNEGRKIKDICKILKIDIKNRYKKELEIMKIKKIEVIEYYNSKYPMEFKRLEEPPILIYALGDSSILSKTEKIAVIGARNASDYGIYISRKIGNFLAQNKINVVSGLAKGIDVNSHIGVLQENIKNKNSGKAIAVIGNGLDNIYPYENQKIAKNILDNGGCIISEYLVRTRPLKMNFPARNRIISALSEKLVVVEARKEKSGTLITVDFSLDLGNEVFAVPGNITSINSSGTNELIKDGARIISDIKDIISEEY